MGPQVLPLTPDDCTIAFLPSAHIAQRVVIEMLPIRMGVPVWFSESLAKLPHEMKTIRPTFLLAPPRVWERIFASINDRDEEEERGGAEDVSRRGRIGRRSEPPARRGQARSKTHAARCSRSPTGWYSRRFARVWVAGSTWRLRAQRRWAKIWPDSTRPSACLSSKATGSPRAAWFVSTRPTARSPAASA